MALFPKNGNKHDLAIAFPGDSDSVSHPLPAELDLKNVEAG
jgi:hypothetical protein